MRALRPEPGVTVASLFAEWWRLDQHVEPADEAEDQANNNRMRELADQMLALPTITAADFAMMTIASTYHGGFCIDADDALLGQLCAFAGVDAPRLRCDKEAA